MRALAAHFKAGTYDILRKNCNSFTDCALYYCIGRRLDEQYRALEKLGADADRVGLVRLLSLGDYVPNPNADDFDVDYVVELAERGQKAAARSEEDGKAASQGLKDLGRQKLSEVIRRPHTYYVGQKVQVLS